MSVKQVREVEKEAVQMKRLKSHMQGWKLGLVPIAVATALVCAACGGTKEEGGNSSASSGSAEVIRIGADFGQSGEFAPYGIAGLAGVRLAAKDIDDEGGFEVAGKRYKLEVEAKDNRSEPAVATSSAIGLIRDNDIKFMFGPSVGVVAGPVAQVVQSQHVMFFSSASLLEPLLTKESVGPGGKDSLIFHTLISEQKIAEYNAEGLQRLLPNVKKIAILWPNDANATFILPIFEKVMKEKGFEIVSDTRFSPTATDFEPYLTKVKASKPDILFVSYVVPESAAMLRQAENLHVAPAYMNWNIPPSQANLAGRPMKQPLFILYNTRQPYDPTTPAAKRFFTDMKSLLGELPELAGLGAWYYDYVYMLVSAMEQAHSTTNMEAIASALSKVKRNGVLGPNMHFNEVHSTESGVDIGIVKNGKFTATALGGE